VATITGARKRVLEGPPVKRNYALASTKQNPTSLPPCLRIDPKRVALFGWLQRRDLARLIIPHGRNGWHGRAIREGATLAVHSMLGYAGGFVGPLLVGWMLDLSGGAPQLGWGSAFLSVAMLMALALLTFWVIRPRELAGDKLKPT
jgi:hypothetical protein